MKWTPFTGGSDGIMLPSLAQPQRGFGRAVSS